VSSQISLVRALFVLFLLRMYTTQLHTDRAALLHIQEAQAAKQHTQGYNLDKRHAFKVNMFDEFDKFLKTSDSYEAPEDKEYQPTENLQVSNAIVSQISDQISHHSLQ